MPVITYLLVLCMLSVFETFVIQFYNLYEQAYIDYFYHNMCST